VELNDKAMRALLDAFDNSDWQEMTVTLGADTLHVSRQADGASAPPSPPPTASAAAAPAPASAPAGPDAAAAPPAATSGAEPTPAPVATDAAPGPAPDAPAPTATSDAPGKGDVVASPSVGLFWRAPSPGAPPFVEVGARVEVGDTVAIVEVMKLMNHVSAPVAGVVTSILAENGATVEYGQPLVTIDPEG
jgi:acetyl-CoA carboxylase biotin carboxyl carrier protein